MNWRLSVAAEALGDISEAAVWFALRGPRARDAFLRSVADTLGRIEENPLQYQRVHGAVRRVKVGRFPYVLLYTVEETTITVALCFHTSRDPKRWQSRYPP